jgi:hypothetical protein
MSGLNSGLALTKQRPFDRLGLLIPTLDQPLCSEVLVNVGPPGDILVK